MKLDVSITTPQRSALRSHPIALLVAAGVVAVTDHLTKWWAINALDDSNVIELVWTLQFRLVFNTGIAFGGLSGLGPWNGLLTVLVVAFLLTSKRLAPDRFSVVAIGIVTGGAIGNLIDRIFRYSDGFLSGAVVDFIDVQFWPVWNVADMAVVIGVAAIALRALRSPTTSPATAPAQSTDTILASDQLPERN